MFPEALTATSRIRGVASVKDGISDFFPINRKYSPDLTPLIAHARLDTGSVPLELRCMNEWREVDCEALATCSIIRGPRMSMTDSDPFAYATAAKPVEYM